MAYKTKAEKKAFLAGVNYQKKHNIVWKTDVRYIDDGTSFEYLIKAPSALAARKKFDRIRKKNLRAFKGTIYTFFSKHPMEISSK